jgi:hypothetical protein
VLNEYFVKNHKQIIVFSIIFVVFLIIGVGLFSYLNTSQKKVDNGIYNPEVNLDPVKVKRNLEIKATEGKVISTSSGDIVVRNNNVDIRLLVNKETKIMIAGEIGEKKATDIKVGSLASVSYDTVNNNLIDIYVSKS